jgi:hypothetical protein
MKKDLDNEFQYQQQLTNGNVNEGYRGLRAFVSRKQRHCKLIGYRPALPH